MYATGGAGELYFMQGYSRGCSLGDIQEIVNLVPALFCDADGLVVDRHKRGRHC